MTDDIVARLRGSPAPRGFEKPFHVTMAEAADEIERLREVVLLGVNARKCQVIYFKTRNRDALLVSKNAERAFDDAARAALAGEVSDGAAAQSVRETIILTEEEKRSFEMSRELAQIYNRVMLERKLSDDAAT
jgi:hypothetical protein